MGTHAEHVPATLGTSGCLYELAGKFCGATVRARGYCQRHYKLLNRHGAFKPAKPEPLEPGSATTEAQIDRNLGHLERARLALEKHTEALVGHLMVAAERAALKGDSRPAEWGLLHSRALQPVLTGGAASSGKGADAHQGIRVIVGVQLQQAPVNTLTVAAQPNPTNGIHDTPENAGDNFCHSQSLPAIEAQLVTG